MESDRLPVSSEKFTNSFRQPVQSQNHYYIFLRYILIFACYSFLNPLNSLFLCSTAKVVQEVFIAPS